MKQLIITIAILLICFIHGYSQDTSQMNKVLRLIQRSKDTTWIKAYPIVQLALDTCYSNGNTLLWNIRNRKQNTPELLKQDINNVEMWRNDLNVQIYNANKIVFPGTVESNNATALLNVSIAHSKALYGSLCTQLKIESETLQNEELTSIVKTLISTALPEFVPFMQK